MNANEVRIGPWQMLADLGPDCDRARRNAAGRALLELLERLVASDLAAARRGAAAPEMWRIPKERRPDAVYAIAERAIRKAPLSVVADAQDDLEGRDARCAGYLRRMLLNWWIDELRAGAERPAVELTEQSAPVVEESILETHRPLFERVCEAAIEARPERYRADLRVAWAQTWDLVTETRSMADILARDEGVGDGTARPELVKARDRVYKRAERLRGYMLDAADEAHDRGALSDEDHRVVTAFITRVMVRCQTRPPRAVNEP